MEFALHRLRMLREVARRDGVSAAARALHYSPSGVSQQLAALEDEVGAPLLERVGRGVRLTDVGRVLAEHAEVILDAEQQAQAAVEQVRDTLAAELMAGVFSTVSAALVPAVTADLAERHPEIRLTTRETDPEDAVVDLRHGHLDLAFMIDYPDASEPWPSGLRTVSVGVEDLHLAAPAGQFTDGPVRLADLADLDWVISGPHTYYGRAVRAACRRAGFDLRVTHQVDEQATALAMVASGAGITLMSDLGKVFCPDTVDVFPLTKAIKRRLVVAHHPEATRRPAIRAVLESIAAAAAALELHGRRR
ncbi:MAG: LysR family transcriptional regulator [Streptosporangiales bacterium]|nr:LysR family transcriptional regulator [Streptosporangiales bacterium]